MKLRIALIHPYPWTEVRRGGERYLSDLAWYLVDAGHDVDVLVSAPGRPRVELVDGVTVRTYPRIDGPWVQRQGFSAVETHGLVDVAVLAKRRYDIVHSLSPTGALAGALTFHRTIYSELGHPTVAELHTRRAAKYIYPLVTRFSTVVTGLSRSAANAIKVTSGRDAEVLPAGVRIDEFPAALGAREGPPRVLFVGDASVWRKGVKITLLALGRLLDRHPDARLELGGPGDHMWAVDALGDDAGRILAAVDVLGVGRRDELPGRYQRATVTVMPSEYEAFGLVLAESLACGTPVVCTDDGGMPEIVNDPAIGRTFPVGDVDGFAQALGDVIDLAHDPLTPARCRESALRWDWQTSVGPKHEALYQRVARRAQ